MNIVKILFYTVVFLTSSFFLPPHIVYTTEFYSNAQDASNLIIERDTIHDTMREHETQIEALNQRLLNLKMDQEWVRLKIEAIKSQHRIIPQALIESKNNLLNKQKVIEEEKRRLMEQVRIHKNAIKKKNLIINKSRPGMTNQGGITTDDLFSDVNKKDSHLISMSDSGAKERLKKEIKALDLEEWVELIDDPSGVRLDFYMPILFPSGKSKVNDSYNDFLSKLAKLTKPYDVKVHVKGYTDSLKSKSISNIELGAKRAAKIVNELIKYGMHPKVFQVSSRGEYRKGSHVNKKNHAFNRNAELTVYFQRS